MGPIGREAVERGTHQVILAERFDRLLRNLDVQRYPSQLRRYWGRQDGVTGHEP